VIRLSSGDTFIWVLYGFHLILARSPYRNGCLAPHFHAGLGAGINGNPYYSLFYSLSAGKACEKTTPAKTGADESHPFNVDYLRSSAKHGHTAQSQQRQGRGLGDERLAEGLADETDIDTGIVVVIAVVVFPAEREQVHDLHHL